MYSKVLSTEGNKEGEIRNREYYRAEAYVPGGSAYCVEAHALGGLASLVTLSPCVAKACQSQTHQRVRVAKISRE